MSADIFLDVGRCIARCQLIYFYLSADTFLDVSRYISRCQLMYFFMSADIDLFQFSFPQMDWFVPLKRWLTGRHSPNRPPNLQMHNFFAEFAENAVNASQPSRLAEVSQLKFSICWPMSYLWLDRTSIEFMWDCAILYHQNNSNICGQCFDGQPRFGEFSGTDCPLVAC